MNRIIGLCIYTFCVSGCDVEGTKLYRIDIQPIDDLSRVPHSIADESVTLPSESSCLVEPSFEMVSQTHLDLTEGEEATVEWTVTTACESLQADAVGVTLHSLGDDVWVIDHPWMSAPSQLKFFSEQEPDAVTLFEGVVPRYTQETSVTWNWYAGGSPSHPYVNFAGILIDARGSAYVKFYLTGTSQLPRHTRFMLCPFMELRDPQGDLYYARSLFGTDNPQTDCTGPTFTTP